MPKGVYKRKLGKKYNSQAYNVSLWTSLYDAGYTIKQIAQLVPQCKKVISRELKELGVLPIRKVHTHDTILSMLDKETLSGCWEWTGGVNNKGYGQVRLDGDLILIHRYMYKYFVGELGSYHVCHKCDNPKCANPEHLFLGTQKDNMVDMAKKDRCSSAKLDCQKILEIRSLPISMANTDIAKKYSVSEKTIRKVKARISWAHV